MRTEFNKPDAKFQPVTMTLTFESQKELDAFSGMFNCAPILDALESMGGSFPSYKSFKEVGGDTSRADTFLSSLMNTPYMSHNYKAVLNDALAIIKNLHTDANMALKDDWDRTDSGFECQIEIIEDFCKKHKIDIDKVQP